MSLSLCVSTRVQTWNFKKQKFVYVYTDFALTYYFNIIFFKFLAEFAVFIGISVPTNHKTK